jgi:hypothetical protein
MIRLNRTSPYLLVVKTPWVADLADPGSGSPHPATGVCPLHPSPVIGMIDVRSPGGEGWRRQAVGDEKAMILWRQPNCPAIEGLLL